jgi:hypothetical protein
VGAGEAVVFLFLARARFAPVAFACHVGVCVAVLNLLDCC